MSAGTFEGYEEHYLISEDGFGDDICVVRFPVDTVGEVPGGCTDCAWAYRVAYGTAEVLTDVDGVCANSELGLGPSKIAELESSEAAYGYVYEYAGHVNVLLKYDAGTERWGPNGNANWNETTGILRFNRPDGYCGY